VKWTIKRWNANLPNRFPKLNLIPAQRLVAVGDPFPPLTRSADGPGGKRAHFVDFVIQQK